MYVYIYILHLHIYIYIHFTFTFYIHFTYILHLHVTYMLHLHFTYIFTFTFYILHLYIHFTYMYILHFCQEKGQTNIWELSGASELAEFRCASFEMVLLFRNKLVLQPVGVAWIRNVMFFISVTHGLTQEFPRSVRGPLGPLSKLSGTLV